MPVSVFDMFRVGIGPSSSHTVGPMRAAKAFADHLSAKGLLERTERVRVELMGSLAATGHGHGPDTATQLGLTGEVPETCDPDRAKNVIAEIAKSKSIAVNGTRRIGFEPARDIQFHAGKVPAYHANAMELTAFDEKGASLFVERYYSVGGGFIVRGRTDNPEEPTLEEAEGSKAAVPHPFKSASELLALAAAHRLTIAELIMENETAQVDRAVVEEKLDAIWDVMHASMMRGMRETEPLPGPFRIARRARRMVEELETRPLESDPLAVLDWVNVYAIAVSEENAAGGRVVTAPTNGAAGVVPAVIQYYLKHTPNPSQEGVRQFLLTAGAIGSLYKENASISGAEVGCQGEVGVACSMAAGGLAAVLGGNNHQIENAAEIGMEHNLGLTCDPVAGQVQIPCIERNAIAAVKAINAARMALHGNGSHYVSLDKVIRTMLETGRDMQSKYKETSRGGLAVNIVEC